MRPSVIISELEPCEAESLRLALRELGRADDDAWLDVSWLRGWLLPLAVRRRVNRLTRVERIGTTSAIKNAASAFGITAARCRGLYYRSFARSEKNSQTVTTEAA